MFFNVDETKRSLLRNAERSLLGVLVLFVFLGSSTAFASPGLTYHGRLLKPDGTPVTSSSVQFRIRLRSPVPEDCLMYEEIQTKDLSQNQGVFSITLNDGTATTPNSEPFTLDRIFQNRGVFSFAAGKCVGTTTYSPSSMAGRVLSVAFNDGSFSGWEPLPNQGISYVPLALEAVSVGGFKATEMFRVLDGSNQPVTLGPWSEANYDKLVDIVNGTANIGGSAAGFTGSLAGDVTGGQATTKVERLQGRSVLDTAPSDGQVLGWNHANSRWEPITISASGSVDWTAITNKPATFAPGGSAGGDLSGTYPDPVIANNAVTAAKINNGAVTTAKLQAGSADGQVFRYQSGAWSITQLEYTDLVNSLGGSPWPTASCDPGEVVVWTSASDSFVCQAFTPTLAAGSVGTTELADGSVTAAKLATSVADGLWQASGGNVYRTTGNVGVGTNTPAVRMEVAGALRLSGTDVDTYTTPVGSTVPTKLSIPFYDPGAFGQIVAMGLPSTAPATSRVISLFDARTGAHQPTLSVFSPNETQVLGFSFDGSNTVGSVKSSADLSLGAWNGERIRLTNGNTVITGAPFDNVFLGDTVMGTDTDYGAILNITTSSRAVPTVGLKIKGELGADGRALAHFDTESTSEESPVLRLTGGNETIEVLSAMADGKVGIGTLTPTENLEVAGGIKGTKLCIAADCRTSWPSAGGGGTVTEVATGTGLTGGPINGTGTISIAAEGVGTAELADGAVTGDKLETIAGLTAGVYGSGTSIPQITVDATGRITAVTGTAVAALPSASGASGKFLKSDGTAWTGQNILFSDIKNSLGGSAFSLAACGSNKTVAWSALTDTFSCQDIDNLDADKITSGTLNSARLPTSITDALWTANSGHVYRSTGNVGIGVSAPTDLLDARSSSNYAAINVKSTYSSGGGAMLRLDRSQSASNVVSKVSFMTAGSNDWNMGIAGIGAGANDFNVYNYGTSTFALSILKANNNVGIGTVSPQKKLHVRSDGAFQTRLENGSSGGGFWNIGQADSSFGTGGGKLLFVPDSDVATNATVAFTNAGQVGIGTASPTASALLDVSSTTKGFLPPRLTSAQKSALVSPAAGLIVYDTTENKLYVYNGTRWAVASDSESGVFQAVRSGNLSVPNGGTQTTVTMTAENLDADAAFDPATGQYTVPRDGFYHFSASANFDAINTYAGLSIRTLSGTLIANTFQQMSAGTQLYLNAAGSYYLTAGEKVYPYVWQWNSGSANITTALFSGFRVGAGGNGGGGAADNLGNHTATQNIILGSNWLSGDGQNEGLRVGSNGYVGVGFATPSSLLHVHSTTSNATDLQFTHNASGTAYGSGFRINYTANAVRVINQTSGGPLSLATSGTDRLTVSGSGNVGIGTASPSTPLHVSNTATTTNAVGTLESTGVGGRPYLGFRAEGNSYGYIGFGSTGNDNMILMNYRNERLQLGTDSVSRLTITGAGDVGIGTISPSYKLDVQGGDINASGTVRSAGVALTSDLRFKRNVHTLDGSLAKILRLRGVGYDWRSDEFPDRHFNNRAQIGLIAQEVEKEYPEVVDIDSKGYRSVNYPALVSPLIEATKEVYGLCEASAGQIAELQRQMAAKDREIASLKQENEEIRARLQRIEELLQEKK